MTKKYDIHFFQIKEKDTVYTTVAKQGKILTIEYLEISFYSRL